VHASGRQLISENASLSLVHLEDGAMKSAIGIAVFQSESVVLLVGEETDYSTTAIGSCSLAESHRQATRLLTLLAQNDIPNGSDLYFYGGLSTFLEPQRAALNGKAPAGIAPSIFETEEMRGANAEGCRSWGAGILSKPRAAPDQQEK
jgi:hypothetical protein